MYYLATKKVNQSVSLIYVNGWEMAMDILGAFLLTESSRERDMEEKPLSWLSKS